MNPVLPFILKQFNKYWHLTILTFATCPKFHRELQRSAQVNISKLITPET